MRKKLLIACVLASLTLTATACGSSDEATKVENSKETAESNDSNSTKKNTFSVGDTAELNDVQVTLSKAVLSNGGEYDEPDSGNYYLGLKFKIVNNSSEDLNVSSIMSFEAYCDDESLNDELSEIPELKGKQLDGDVAAGKKMTGVIVYQVPKDFKKFEISYTPNELNDATVTFKFSKKKVDASAVE